MSVIITSAKKSIRIPKEIVSEEKNSNKSEVLKTVGKNESDKQKVAKETKTARNSLILLGEKKVKIPPINGKVIINIIKSINPILNSLKQVQAQD
ncbi:MAG: hypothetical protein QME68_02715 [Elusimicrobiota bacterium]|nr:hypothetical protein [Elusimicrobiota bacterium]